jgi:hypothetical protein
LLPEVGSNNFCTVVKVGAEEDKEDEDVDVDDEEDEEEEEDDVADK